MNMSGFGKKDKDNMQMDTIHDHPKTLSEVSPLHATNTTNPSYNYQSQTQSHHLNQLQDSYMSQVQPLFNPENQVQSHSNYHHHSDYQDYVTQPPQAAPLSSSFNGDQSVVSPVEGYEHSRYLLQRHNMSLPYHHIHHQQQQQQQQQQTQPSLGQQLPGHPQSQLHQPQSASSGLVSATNAVNDGNDNDDFDDADNLDSRSNSLPASGPSQKSITNTNKYKKFKQKIIEGVQETIDKGISLSDLAKYYKINSKSSLKERENFKNIFSIRCLMEIAYVTDTNERGTEVLRSSLYLIYHNLCDSLKVEAIGPSSIGKLIRIAFPKIRTKRLGIRGQSKYHYTGIKLKDRYIKLVEQLDDGDSNLKLNRILICNLNLPKAVVERSELAYSDFMKSQSESKIFESTGGLITMNPDTESIFYAYLTSLLEKRNFRLGAQQILLNNNNHNYGYPQNYMLELLVCNNVVKGLERLAYKPEFKDLRTILTQLSTEYESIYSRELKQLEPDTIDYKQRTKLAKHFVDSMRSIVHVSEFTDELNYTLTTQSYKLLDDFSSLKLDEVITEYLKEKLSKITAEESLFNGITKSVSDFKTFLTTGDPAVMLPIEPSVNIPMFQFIGSTRGYPQVYRYTQFLLSVVKSFKNYRLTSVGITFSSVLELILKKVMKNPARSENVKNWVILSTYTKDWLSFNSETTYLKYLYYEQSLIDEDDRNTVH